MGALGTVAFFASIFTALLALDTNAVGVPSDAGVDATFALLCIANVALALGINQSGRERVAALIPPLAFARNITLAIVLFGATMQTWLQNMSGGWELIDTLELIPRLGYVTVLFALLSGLTALTARETPIAVSMVAGASLLVVALLVSRFLPRDVSCGLLMFPPSDLSRVDASVLHHRPRLWLALTALAIVSVPWFRSRSRSRAHPLEQTVQRPLQRTIVAGHLFVLILFATEALIARLLVTTGGTAYDLITIASVSLSLAASVTMFCVCRCVMRECATQTVPRGPAAIWLVTLLLVTAIPTLTFAWPNPREASWRQADLTPATGTGFGRFVDLQATSLSPSFLLTRTGALIARGRHTARDVHAGEVFVQRFEARVLFDENATVSDLLRIASHLRGAGSVRLAYLRHPQHDLLSRRLFPNVASIDNQLAGRDILLTRPPGSTCSEAFRRDGECVHPETPSTTRRLEREPNEQLASLINAPEVIAIEIDPTLTSDETLSEAPRAPERWRSPVRLSAGLCAGVVGIVVGGFPRRRRRDDQA